MFLRSIMITVLFALCSACTAKELEKQIFLISEGYVGSLEIAYGVPNGEDGQYENEARVYNFNDQGVHFTQLESPWGTGTPDSFQFYYVDKNGNRTSILLSDFVRIDEIGSQITDSNKYIIYGGAGSIGSHPCDFGIAIFYVGTYKNWTERVGIFSVTDYLEKKPNPCIKTVTSSTGGCAC